ncbi:MAG TPA: hypothetical protein VG713_08670 [Pirellulales bacterium]|nr:hypothetical protein [Pirellulales bacterium]
MRNWPIIFAIMLIGRSLGAASPVTIDESLVRAAGIRSTASQHLTLYTDLPASPAIDELPAVFDQAFGQWCTFFAKRPADAGAWRVRAFLMLDRQRFAQAGLLPGALPSFRNGFAWDADVWIVEQPADYYRRHLLLHEGTHAFMNTVLGNCGPPWFMEGVAELLATHRWVDGRLTLGYFPKTREEVDHWGRIKLVRESIASGRRQSIDELMALKPQGQLENDVYGWCWALATLLDAAPRYHDRFRAQLADVTRDDFNRRFRERFASDWHDLLDDWQVFSSTLVYGDDVRRAAIDFGPGKPLVGGRGEANVVVDRLWQTGGVRLEAGRRYQLRASGRFTLRAGPPAWACEANGVSIHYHDARPLGMLLAVVRPDAATAQSAFLDPQPVGLEAVVAPKTSGTLYLGVNDSPADLDQHQGSVRVEIIELPGPP